LIGVQLINKIDTDGNVIAFDASDEELAMSLASQAAVAINKQQLINDLEFLLESFLTTINVAIEEKSPYTAGHIDRMVLSHSPSPMQSAIKRRFLIFTTLKII
jgi:hypothetical protein